MAVFYKIPDAGRAMEESRKLDERLSALEKRIAALENKTVAPVQQSEDFDKIDEGRKRKAKYSAPSAFESETAE